MGDKHDVVIPLGIKSYNNDNFEIIVGIDGCEKTFEYMKTIMHNYKNLKQDNVNIKIEK